MKLLWRPLLSSKMHLNSGNTGDRVILSLAASDLFWHLLSELFSLLLAASGRHSLRPAGWPSCSPPKDHTPRMAARPLSSLSPLALPPSPVPHPQHRHQQLYFKELPVSVSVKLMHVFETCTESPIQASALLLLPDKWRLSVCLWMSSEKWGIEPPSNLGQKKYPVEWVLSTVLFFPFNPEAFLFPDTIHFWQLKSLHLPLHGILLLAFTATAVVRS